MYLRLRAAKIELETRRRRRLEEAENERNRIFNAAARIQRCWYQTWGKRWAPRMSFAADVRDLLGADEDLPVSVGLFCLCFFETICCFSWSSCAFSHDTTSYVVSLFPFRSFLSLSLLFFIFIFLSFFFSFCHYFPSTHAGGE